MRYTEKALSTTGVETGYYKLKTSPDSDSITYIQDGLGNYIRADSRFLAIQKLASVENKEEMIGTDIAFLANAILAVKEGAYVSPWGKIRFEPSMRIEKDDYGNLVLFDSCDNDYRIEDFGKTWDISKEHLAYCMSQELWDEYCKYTTKFRDACEKHPDALPSEIPEAVEAREEAEQFVKKAKELGFEHVKENGWWKFKYVGD